jgi:hypothetical protein
VILSFEVFFDGQPCPFVGFRSASNWCLALYIPFSLPFSAFSPSNRMEELLPCILKSGVTLGLFLSVDWNCEVDSTKECMMNIYASIIDARSFLHQKGLFLEC